MFDMLRRLFGRNDAPREVSEAEEAAAQAFGEAKAAALEELLGKSADFVYHAIIPYAVGGPVDVYLYPHTPHGTALATQELIEVDGTGPVPNVLGTYELVMFTRHPVSETAAPGEGQEAEDTPFEKAVLQARSLMTGVGRYSGEARLEPGHTAEFPADEEGAPNIALLFARYPEDGRALEIAGRQHGLLCIVCVHPQELAFAREHGSEALVEKLKEAGHWPRFDLDRPSVI